MVLIRKSDAWRFEEFQKFPEIFSEKYPLKEFVWEQIFPDQVGVLAKFSDKYVYFFLLESREEFCKALVGDFEYIFLLPRRYKSGNLIKIAEGNRTTGAATEDDQWWQSI